MKAKFTFTNIDESLYTKEECSVTMDIEADNHTTAYLLAMHLQKMLGADYFDIEE
jgi:hypothetical protein